MEDDQPGQVPFELECPHCKKVFSFSDFTASIIQYGLILLDGVEEYWFGCTCFFCAGHSTVIQKFQKNKLPQELADIYNSLLNDQEWLYHYMVPESNQDSDAESEECFSYGKWFYNSFPYHFERLAIPLFSHFSVISSKQNKVSEYPEPEPHSYDKDSIPPGKEQEVFDLSYCSYQRGGRVFGPAIMMLWFSDDQVLELAELESQGKKKVFPRYSLYDETLENIQFFCWDNKYQFEFVKQVSNDTGIPIIDFLSVSSKKRITIAYDFLNILDQPPSFLNTEPEKGNITIRISQKNIQPLTALPADSIYTHKRTREYLTEKVWDNLFKDYIQDTLSFNAEKFIQQFYDLSKSISFSYGSVWALKEKCLKELDEILHSKYQKRKKERERDKEIQQQALEAEKAFPGVNIISQSRSINELKIHISKFHKALTMLDFKGPVLILGEKGTGKTDLAFAIHQALKLKGDFKKVDCGQKVENLFESELFGHKKGAFTGAIENKKGAFELASKGTIFLDEIANIPITSQQKLLGVLQNREYEPVGAEETKKADAFIIVATNADLDTMAQNDQFKGDLLDRIDKYRIVIPPLRERKKDIPLILRNIITKVEIDPELDRQLIDLDYEWPGNIRELINIIKGIEMDKVMYEDNSPVCLEDFLKHLKTPIPSKSPKLSEKKLPGNTKINPEQVKEAMLKHNGNKTKAAKELGVTYATILRHCKKFGN